MADKEYVERKELLKDIEEERPVNWTDSESERQAESDFYKYRDIVMMQPTADVVEVKHGEWLKTDAYPHRVYCSLCYKTYVTNEEIIRGRSDGYPTYCREAKYCPHCGAKMDLKEGTEE